MKLNINNDAAYDVSIIIPVFNNLVYTRKAITSIYENTEVNIDWEIILIDNGSTDGTDREQARDHRTRWIHNKRNIGFAKACNMGAEISEAQYLVFLNNDTEVFAGWLEALLEELKYHPFTGVAGPRLIYPDGTIQQAGIAVGRARSQECIDFFHKYARSNSTEPEVMLRTSCCALTGACMAVRTSEFLWLGMFDAGFINGGEDVELCARYRRAGYKCVYRPDSLVMHYESKSEGRHLFNHENDLRLVEKALDMFPQNDFCSAVECQQENSYRIELKLPVVSGEEDTENVIESAENLGKALTAAGHSCLIYYRDEWHKTRAETDIIIHLAGQTASSPQPGKINIVWLLSAPFTHLLPRELEHYDAICVASSAHARQLATLLSKPVHYLPHEGNTSILQ